MATSSETDRAENLMRRLRGGPEGNGWSCDFASEMDLISDAALEIGELAKEVGWLREVVRLVVDDDTAVLNEGGYLVVDNSGDPEFGSAVIDLTPEQFAAVKRALAGRSERHAG